MQSTRKIVVVSVVCLLIGVAPLLAQGEFLIDTSIAGIPVPGRQANPTLAFGGTDYLVVWQDHTDDDTHVDIRGARVTPSGIILDPTSIPISVGDSATRYSPDIASDGVNYFVVWGGWNAVADYEYVKGRRASKEGVILDSTETWISISDPCGTLGVPSVAFNGVDYLVVWGAGGCTHSRIEGARIGTEGSGLDRFSITEQEIYRDMSPAVCFGNAHYLVVWERSDVSEISTICGARVTPSGEVLDTIVIIVSARLESCMSPSVAFDGKNYMVVWIDQRNGNNDIYGARIDTSGTVLDTGGVAVSIASTDRHNLCIAFNDSNYIILWQDGWGNDSRVFGCLVDTGGTVLDSLVSGQLSVYPNPFAHNTVVEFVVRSSQFVDEELTSIRIHDAAGRLVKTLVNEGKEPGKHSATLDASELSAGIYFARLSVGKDHREAKKLILVR
jgi:hypothetical protein